MNRPIDILIVGGGTGGTAAAMAATNLGRRVALTEETSWLGGQLTSQAVPPDEHPWIESYGRTRRYCAYRNRVRAYYRANYPLTAEAYNHPTLNPGGGFVSALCHEPRVGVAVIDEMLAPAMNRGLLDVYLNHRPIAAETDGDRVSSVTLEDLMTGATRTLSAPYILDATEIGDLLALAKVEYVSGAEPQGQHGELHAPNEAAPDNVQALTWCFAMAYDPDGEHVINKPDMYDFWHDYVPQLSPQPWPGKLIDWTMPNPATLESSARVLFPPPFWSSLFQYRKIIRNDISTGEKPHEATIVNWPQNDYLPINIIDKPRDVVDRALYEARQLSLSLFYWMQTEASRQDGGQGYPGLYLRGDLTGTNHGLAMAPYIRESRRIEAVFTVTEAHIGAEMLAEVGRNKAVEFYDSVGTGFYRIDLHPSTGGDNYIDVESRPFQIPLGALLPVRVTNLLPACKNLGVTPISNGCFRLHPVEWNIGESAGLLAAFCIKRGVTPHAVRDKPDLFVEFRQLIAHQGVETSFPAHLWQV